jgi:hypothetical protein
MSDEDATRIIDQVLKAHWPNWTFNGKETLVWIRELRKYNYEMAKAAINNFYMAQTKQGKPAPAHLLMALRKYARIRQEKEEGQSREPVLLFEIIKEGRERGQRFFSNPSKPSDQEIEEYSERGRKAFNSLYGGNHIVVRQCKVPI